MRLNKISDRVYANTEKETGGNVGIILLEKCVVAVDSKYPTSGIEFRRSILKLTSRPVTHLLLTHYHGDHVFGNQAFEDCEIIAHSLLKKKMEENLKTIWKPANLKKMIEEIKTSRPQVAPQYEGLKITLPNKTFDRQFVLDGIKMLHVPGHTADSSIVYISDDHILFSGDLIFAKSFPWGGDPSANPDSWIKAFKRILKMNVETIVPGHGQLCDKTEIKAQLDWFEAIRKKMKKLIKDGISLEEAVKYSKYPKLYEPESEDWRENTLRHWYEFWKEK